MDPYRSSHTGPHAQEYARVYSDRYPAQFWAQVELPALMAACIPYVSGRNNSVHLDLASGTGRLYELTEGLTNWTYIGVDFSPEMIEIARCNPRAKLVRGDVTCLPVRSGSVQLVTLFRFLLNASPTTRRSVLLEAFRVLDAGGVCVVNVHAIRSSIVGIKQSLVSALSGRPQNVMRADEFMQLVAERFEIVRSLRLGVIPVTARVPAGPFANWLTRLERLMCRSRWIVTRVGSEQILVLRRKEVLERSPRAACNE